MSECVRRRLSTGFLLTVSALSISTDSEGEGSDLSFLRRHGSAHFRAFRSSESSTSRDSLRSIVVTPASIPQFTIPKLAVQERDSAKDTQPAGDTEDLSDPLQLSSSVSSSSLSSSSLFSSSPATGRKAQRSISDPADHHRMRAVRGLSSTFMESDQCSDPATRGALSLPHLAKITTPYGFVTLSQSPQMANEDELLPQKGHRSWARDQKNMPLRNLRTEMKSSSSARTLPVQRHRDADSHHVSGGISNSDPHICSGSFPSAATASRPKQTFWGVLRQHLSNQKLNKCI